MPEATVEDMALDISFYGKALATAAQARNLLRMWECLLELSNLTCAITDIVESMETVGGGG